MQVGLIDNVVKSGVRVAAWAFRGDTYLGKPLKDAPKNPDPIVLVNGFTVHNEVMDAAVNSLERDGFKVFLPELPNNAMDDVTDTAAWLRTYVDNVRKETGAKKVDLVGFSEGGLVEREYIKNYGGDRYVDSAISVATPHNGVLVSPVGSAIKAVPYLDRLVPEAAIDMIKGSDFLTQLNAGDPTPGKDVRWTSIYSKGFDGIVWPASSPILEGARNVALHEESWFPGLRGPHHLGLQGSHEGYRHLREALLEKR